MNKTLLAGLLCTGLALSSSVSFARNPLKDLGISQNSHHGTVPNTLTLGDYTAICNQPINGTSSADLRTVQVGNHSQQVVHLMAQSANLANAFVTNLDNFNISVVLNTPIQFTLVKGNGKYLNVVIVYTPPGGGSDSTTAVGFITPDSQITGPDQLPLVSNGNGKYTIPLGTSGIPSGSTLQLVSFLQSANPNTCVKHTSDINELVINRQFIPLDTSPAAQCGIDCTVGGGGGAGAQ